MTPRLGFLGVGWIGRLRLEAVRDSGLATIAAVADPSEECRAASLRVAPGARAVATMGELLEETLDGVVIATPSSQHAEQAEAFLERGVPVFCQKPLGRSEAETARVVETARRRDRRLGVDLCYRHTAALAKVRELVSSGELGRVYALDLVFHNAYGPDKPWFYDRALSGGGCVMDLGIHLVDAAIWLLDAPRVTGVDAQLFAGGAPLSGDACEDYATARLRLDGGGVARLACSWNLPAGQDAVISVCAYGTQGGASFHNVGGSFYDFVAERHRGTATERLVDPPDAWGGRTVVRWAEQIAQGARGFDASADELVHVARILDAIYACRDADGSS